MRLWCIRNPYAPCINPEMVSVSCTSKPLDVLNGFQQIKKMKDLESLPSFSFRLTQLEERNFAGEIRATSPDKSRRSGEQR